MNYRLYGLGWRSGLHERLPLLVHYLLSIFYLYRRGFADGSEWIEEYYAGKRIKR